MQSFVPGVRASLSVARSVSCVHVLSPFVGGTHTASLIFQVVCAVKGRRREMMEICKVVAVVGKFLSGNALGG